MFHYVNSRAGFELIISLFQLRGKKKEVVDEIELIQKKKLLRLERLERAKEALFEKLRALELLIAAESE